MGLILVTETDFALMIEVYLPPAGRVSGPWKVLIVNPLQSDVYMQAAQSVGDIY